MSDDGVDYGGIPEAAPSCHPPHACLQIHEVETSIEQIESTEVWVRVDCEKCGQGRFIKYTRGDNDE